MFDRVKPFLVGFLGVLAALGLTAAAYGGWQVRTWALERYVEFTVMRTVTIAVVCKDFAADAAKVGITCPQPQPGQGAVAPGNASPPMPTQ